MKLVLLGAVASAVVLSGAPAHAYIDPGTGSMLVQMIVAGVAAGFTTIGLYWSKITSLFRRGQDANKSDSN